MKLFQSHREHHISWYHHILIQNKDKGAMTCRNDTDTVRALISKLITVEVDYSDSLQVESKAQLLLIKLI